VKTYRNVCEALADPTSSVARNMAKAQTVMSDNDRVIAAWMARGYTREEAYRAALFGFRKEA